MFTTKWVSLALAVPAIMLVSGIAAADVAGKHIRKAIRTHAPLYGAPLAVKKRNFASSVVILFRLPDARNGRFVVFVRPDGSMRTLRTRHIRTGDEKMTMMAPTPPTSDDDDDDYTGDDPGYY